MKEINMNNERILITLSQDELMLLKLWAAWHGKPQSTYAGHILGSRLEANRGLIEDLVKSAAENRGISYEELCNEWLNE